jgi:hypothetical protein
VPAFFLFSVFPFPYFFPSDYPFLSFMWADFPIFLLPTFPLLSIPFFHVGRPFFGLFSFRFFLSILYEIKIEKTLPITSFEP